MSDSLTPKNRKEQFLQDISDGKTDFTPKNREEYFLKNIADAVKNGGGGGGDMVIPFTINVEEQTTTSNAASFEEVDAALRAGRRVVAILERNDVSVMQGEIHVYHIPIIGSYHLYPTNPKSSVQPLWECFGYLWYGGGSIGEATLIFPDATTREITMLVDPIQIGEEG